MMLVLAKMFRTVAKIFVLCNNLSIRPNTIEFKIVHRKYIELVSKLTTRGPKWNFITALQGLVFSMACCPSTTWAKSVKAVDPK